VAEVEYLEAREPVQVRREVPDAVVAGPAHAEPAHVERLEGELHEAEVTLSISR
jgi:hypothetical protein